MAMPNYKNENVTQNQNSKVKNQSEETRKQETKYKNDLKDMSYHLALRVLKFIDSLPRNMSCEVIGKQLLRSSMSVGANISEARSSSTRKDFVNFLTHSLKSANESIFWLRLLQDSEKADQAGLLPLIREVDEIARILGASIITLKRQEAKS